MNRNKKKRAVTIIMYHFIRDLEISRYPEIKALQASHFKEQLDYISKYYKFVTVNDCINAVYNEYDEFPDNAVLLTFDDAYIDHYTTVFPILEEGSVQGCFFVPVKAVLEHEVLDVNKIHFILATAPNIDDLVGDIFGLLDEYRESYNLKNNEYYFLKLAHKSRFDVKEVIFVKRLLQRELDEALRQKILNRLFEKHVSIDEAAFAGELYMSTDQIKCMIRNGMYIGAHGYHHYWLNSLPKESQEREVDLSLQFLKEIYSSVDSWVMSYPFGAYDDTLINILKKKGCSLAVTTETNIAQLSKENAFTLQRLRTNDLPVVSDSPPNFWSLKT